MNRSRRTAAMLLLASLAALLALWLWWWLRRPVDEQIILATEKGTISRFRSRKRPLSSVGRPQPPAVSRPVRPPADDLKRILGIGPKAANVLAMSGIATFAQLADAAVERLRDILGQAGFRLLDPGTWPEQARLAAQAKWDELEDLQQEIRRRPKGG